MSTKKKGCRPVAKRSEEVKLQGCPKSMGTSRALKNMEEWSLAPCGESVSLNHCLSMIAWYYIAIVKQNSLSLL